MTPATLHTGNNQRLLPTKSVWLGSTARLRAVALAALAIVALTLCPIRRALASFTVIFNGVVGIVNTGSTVLVGPIDVATDAAGNLYITDTGNNRIVKVTPAGASSVLAITGLSPALSSPSGVAFDSAGNLYISDGGNNRIVKVTPAGAGTAISITGLGTALDNPIGLTIDSSANLYVADNNNNRIVKITSAGAGSALAITGLTLSSPAGLAVDATGNLYVADSGNSRVVKVTAGLAGSVLGTNGVTLNGPRGVAVAPNGLIYITDTNGGRIVTSFNGFGSLLSTGSLTLSFPRGITVDALGTVYLADGGNNRALKIQPQAVNFGSTSLTTGTAVTVGLPFLVSSSTTLGSVQALTTGSPNLDFTVLSSGTTCIAGTTNTTCTVNVQFLPQAAGLRRGAINILDGSGNILNTVPIYGVADAPVAALNPGTASVISVGTSVLNLPFQVALDGTGNMYVGNYNAQNVLKIPASGGTGAIVATPTITLGLVTGVALDGAGNLFISDHTGSRIVKVTAAGTASALSISGLSTGLNEPTGLAVDGAGNLFISDWMNSRVVKVTPTGTGTVLSTGSFTIGASSDTGVTVDALGNVYIADRSNNRVLEVSAAGITTVVSFPGVTPALSNPQGVGVDGMGNVYVVDSGNNRIVVLTTSGVAYALSTPGLTAPTTLSAPFGVTVDPSSNVIIPDWTNNRIVKVNLSSSALAFADTLVGSISTDSPKTTIVTNVGDLPLTFASTPPYAANFSLNGSDSNLCQFGSPLTAGTVCDVSAFFTPQSVGLLTANITLTDNNLNGINVTQVVAASGTGIVTADTTAVAVSAGATTANAGQPLTITATVTDTTVGHTATVPTGSVSFTDTVGSTVVSLNGGNSVTLTAGHATLTGVALTGVGAHSIKATYGGVTNAFLANNNTTTVTVSKTAATVAGPAGGSSVSIGHAGSVTITVTGPYTGFAVPTGSVTYNIVNGAGSSVASGPLMLTAGSGHSTVTVPVSASLPPGTYTVTLTYSGDGNYAAASSPVTVALSVGLITPTITWAQPATTILAGTSLSGILNATATSGGTAVPGTFSYTATLAGGTASAVTSASVLAPGSYTLTATFTPTDTTTYATTTATVSLNVQDFSLNISTGTVGGVVSAPTATAAPGGTANYVFAIGPTSGTTFPGAVTLIASGLPTGAVATFTPATIPAGSGTASVMLAISVPVGVSLVELRPTEGSHASRALFASAISLPMFGVLLLPAAMRLRRRTGGRGERLAGTFLILATLSALAGVAGLAGCGSASSGYVPQRSKTFVITVTATSGSLSHSTTVSLVVN